MMCSTLLSSSFTMISIVEGRNWEIVIEIDQQRISMIDKEFKDETFYRVAFGASTCGRCCSC